eukprot:CAMPEP_0181245366 /NCGR_PEP_ID=MMETSP1096-20121128/43377_1 /TAXON_ID=156174 ORGANISM="Chrysochromulina ericina, Strain CCMP281" /NCGR_SAMPLE_ID=MMETSP1096 /ASSEMBLY_ACC=CAM_ASM_000453 /LENGTH=68 /DNA_ID=CAMNT_0023342021 /DNA_START=722 /DNA_END=928 /DNA_ORIENTATION=+
MAPFFALERTGAKASRKSVPYCSTAARSASVVQSVCSSFASCHASYFELKTKNGVCMTSCMWGDMKHR